MKPVFALTLVLALGVSFGAVAAPDSPEQLQSGRSVAVEKPAQTYWLSNDLNRLFLQKPAHQGAGSADAAARD